MLVAAITEVSIANEDNVPYLQSVLGTGAVTGLMFKVGQDRYHELSSHYNRMHQDRPNEIANARDVEEPEFDLQDIAHSNDALHMFVSERLAVDDFIKREAAGAPDVIVVAGNFLTEVADWERQICSHCPHTYYPDRIEIVTRVLQQALSDGMLVITYNEARDGFPPILLAVAEGSSRWLHDVYKTKQIVF